MRMVKWVGMVALVSTCGMPRSTSAGDGDAARETAESTSRKLDAADQIVAGRSIPIGRRIENFTLKDHWGKAHSLEDYDDHRLLVVAFLGTECPLAKLYGPKLQQFSDEFSGKGVAFIAINANSQDSITEIAAYARRHGITFPILKDVGNRIADRFGAVRTPEVFVLDGNRQVRYWGRIDDQYVVGKSRGEPEHEDLRRALIELLNDHPVSTPVTKAVGCHIGRIRDPKPNCEVTYANQISRILQKHCVECHRAGEIGPFELTDYNEVAGWAETIAEVVRDQRMPPWHANPVYGTFSNERRMSDEEKRLVYTWVRSGAPQGDLAQLPPPRTFVTGWRLPREPDVVIPMRPKPFDVPAEGVVEYQYFVVDPGFTEDRWVAATDIAPGSRAVVHHAIVFIAPPRDHPRRGLGWLAAYAPGQGSMSLPAGQGRLVPAGSRLIFQMHYTPNGSPQRDVTHLALVFTDRESVEEEVLTYIAVEDEFEIPPGVAEHRVELVYNGLPANGRLLGLAPHMHLRGKAFRFTALNPDGSSQILLDVPHYDFNWQNGYELAEPLSIPKGFRLRCSAVYDNSKDNLSNPDPSVRVRWGDQSWDEMMVGFFEVAVPVGVADRLRSRKKRKVVSGERKRKAQQSARSLLDRFDKDGDGAIVKSDVPDTFAMFGFRKMDANSDGAINFEEAYQFALRNLR